MKLKWLISAPLFCLTSCSSDDIEKTNNKDLEQNMMDIKIYQENLGDQIKNKNLQDASWFLEGMDSILHILNKKFLEHRRLGDRFSYYYNKRLRSPIQGIREAIKENDTAAALQSYRILVKKCNDCHDDNDVDKVVRF